MLKRNTLPCCAAVCLAAAGQVPPAGYPKIVEAESIHDPEPVGQVQREPEVGVSGHTLGRTRPGLQRGTSTVARDEPIKEFYEAGHFGLGIGISKSSRNIQAMEVIALQADLIRVNGVACLRVAIVGQERVACRVHEAGRKDWRGAWLACWGIKRKSQVDIGPAS